MTRSLLLSVAAVFLAALSIHAAEPGSAVQALNALPAAYRNGVVWVSADNANPNPAQWYITARNSGRGGGHVNIIVARGRIISERPTLSPRAITRQLSPINIRNVRFNSTDLWKEAGRFAEKRGQSIGSLSLQLQQRGTNATPIWSVWCYNRRGSYIGFFSALATTGEIIERR